MHGIVRSMAVCMLLAVAWNSSSGNDDADVEFRKEYVDGRYGQVHILVSRPQSDGDLETPMVCFAPNPMAGRYFRIFMQALGRDRIMIAPDYPGLGESDPPPAAPDMSGYAGAMADVIEALGFGLDDQSKIDVCGYHTGAMVAIELAVSRPDLVNKVLLMGVPYYTGAARAKQYEANVVEEPLNEDFDSLSGWWKFTVTDRQDGVTLERGYDNFVDVLKPKYRHHWPYKAVFSYLAEERAALVTQPVLILNTHGSLEEQTRAIAPYFSNATLIEIPELRHGIFDVGADILAGHARPFLDGAAALE